MNKNSPPLDKNSLAYSQDDVAPIIKPYKIRWLILAIYIICAIICAFQWIQYSSISQAVIKYYNLSNGEDKWTTLVFLIVWPVLLFPVSFIVEKQGLRVAVLIGCFSMAIGSVIKVFSTDRELFHLVVIGQIIVAISHVFLLTLPPKIATTWFKPDEISTACSLGVFGMQFGRALGFLIPPYIIKNDYKVEVIGSELYTLCSGIAATILPMTFIIFMYYPKRPNHAPSQAQLEERVNKQIITLSNFFGSLKTLLANRFFVIHVMTYGICMGIYFATGTLLEQFIHNYFKDVEYSRRINLVMVLVGMLGSVVIGFILDKTQKYKEATFVTYLMSVLSLISLSFALECKVKWIVYSAVGIFGVSMNAYMVAGIEFAMDITFPCSEITATGILLTTSQILNVVFTLLLSVFNSKFGTVSAMALQVVILLIGTLLTYWTPGDQRRQELLRENIVFEKVQQAE